MAGPDYLSMINNSLGPPPVPGPAAPAIPPRGAPDFMGQIGNTLGAAPPGAPLIDNGAIAAMPGLTFAPPSPAGPAAGPPPPPAPAASGAPGGLIGPPADREPGVPPPSTFLQRVASGVQTMPAREVEMRGPQLKEAQGQRNAAFEGAVQAVTERSEHTAAADYAVALEQQRQAGIREDAANYTAAERANELAERQADFDASTKALSKQSVDPTRFWSTGNAGTKIAALISVAIGGFIQGKTGRSNVGMDAVNQAIDRDIKAQEFAYNAARDTVNAKQTAFSMAMQKYQNVDAARASARAAALDVAVTQAGASAAQWKGTEAANRAQMAMAELSQDRASQIMQGVAFVPAKTVATGGGFVDPRTGVTYTNKEAQGVVEKMDTREEKREEQGRAIAGQLIVEGAKNEGKAAKDMRGLTVKLPNGDVVVGRTEAHAKELGDASAAIHETQRLVREAKEIRSSPAFRIPGSAAHAKLAQIQSELITGYSVQNKLGALSESDMGLAKAGTAQLTDFGPGPEAALDRLGETAQSRLRAQVKTLPDAPGSSQGEMPKSFTPHGKK